MPRCIARSRVDLGLGAFDPLTRDLAADLEGPRPAVLAALSSAPWRTSGDTVERIERLALHLVAGVAAAAIRRLDVRTREVLDWINAKLRPVIDACGAGARSPRVPRAGSTAASSRPARPARRRAAGPTCCRPGRNFYSVDVRAVPTPAAWRIGQLAAERLVERYLQEAGEWPRAIALSAWGTANMRTGGDDIAQALALIGARPVWERDVGPGHRLRHHAARRTEAAAGRRHLPHLRLLPRRLSDPDRPHRQRRPRHRRCSTSRTKPIRSPPTFASRRAGARGRRHGSARQRSARRRYRVFGSKPGAYGAGLQALIDEGGWNDRARSRRRLSRLGRLRLWRRRRRRGRARRLRRAAQRRRSVLRTPRTIASTTSSTPTTTTSSGRPRGRPCRPCAGARRAIYHNRSPRGRKRRRRAPLAEEISPRRARPRRQSEMDRRRDAPRLQGRLRDRRDGRLSVRLRRHRPTPSRNHHFDQLFDAYLEDERVRDFMADGQPGGAARNRGALRARRSGAACGRRAPTAPPT